MTIDQFLSYLQYERNRSERTVKAYGDDLRSFEAFFKNLDDQLSWESVDSDVIRSWMESMMDKGNTATSINRRLSAVRSLYRFALSRGIVERDPAHGLKGPKGKKLLPQYLRESEMDRLLADDMWTDEMGDLRARTIILMFYSTGIRLSELTGLDNASVDLEAQQLKVRGKGNKERLIPFGSELQKALRLYTERRDAETPSDSQAFFLRSSRCSNLLFSISRLSPAMTCSEHVNITKLITNLFNFIAVLFYCHYTIVTIFGTVDGIEHQTVVIDVGDRVIVVVTIDAAHQAWSKIKIATECLADIVVELVAEWCGMHHDDGTVELVGILCKLLLHEVKVRY